MQLALRRPFAPLAATSRGGAAAWAATPAGARHAAPGARLCSSAQPAAAAAAAPGFQWAAGAFLVGAAVGGGGAGVYLTQPWGAAAPAEVAAGPGGHHPFQRTLYIMRGVPASGKSTVAHGILREHLSANGVGARLDEITPMSRAFILSTDDFFSPINQETGEETTSYDMSKIKRNHERNQSRCDIAMELGVTPLIVDNTNSRVWEMREYAKMAQAHGYRVVVKDVMASSQVGFDVIKERLLARQAQTGKEIPLHVVEGMMKRWETLPTDPSAAVTCILEAKAPWEQKAQQTK